MGVKTIFFCVEPNQEKDRVLVNKTNANLAVAVSELKNQNGSVSADPADTAGPDDLSYEDVRAEMKPTEGPSVTTDQLSLEEETSKRASLVNEQEINREWEFLGYERRSEFPEHELQRADLEIRRWEEGADSKSVKRW